MSTNKDRWSALSLKDRADLMNMYITNGISDLKEIKKHYNSFSGEEDQNNEEVLYYDDTYIEPATVKAFASNEDYNRYYGEQFGKKVAEGMNNAAPYVLEAAMLPFTISGAVETPMLLYQGVKATPQLVRGAKTLLTKGKKAFGKKVLGMVDDMNDYVKEGSHFRIVDKPAIDDAISSGTIRSKTGLYHGTPEYLRSNFSKYLDDIPGWESMDANELRSILESKGAFEGMSDAAKFEAKLSIRNSTNHGGTVGYFKDMPYPNYTIHNSNYVIETPESIGSFVAGHGGKEYVDIPLEHAGATLLKTNGSVKGASIPSKGSSYWEYNPFFEMWKNKKFNNGGKLLKDNKFFSGGPTKLESREEYLQQQRDSIRLQALQNSLDRTEPSNPIMGKNNMSQEEWEKDKRQRIQQMYEEMSKAESEDVRNLYKQGIEGIKKTSYNPLILGNNCIFTALDNYGEKYKVSGNESFLANPEKYGFKEIKTSEIKPGDLVQQYNPGGSHHMMMFDSYNNEGVPLYNYSSSYNKDARDIKKKSVYHGDNIVDNNNYRAFTFIGNIEDNNKWNTEYNTKRSNYSKQIVKELKKVPQLPKDKVK